MRSIPRWFVPVAAVALLWNLLGCFAAIGDALITPADVAKMSAANQAMYAARPVWGIAGTSIAVAAGVAGCVLLILHRSWAVPVLALSLAGVIVQDLWLFVLRSAAAAPALGAAILQFVVLGVAVGLLALARRALARGWIGRRAPETS